MGSNDNGASPGPAFRFGTAFWVGIAAPLVIIIFVAGYLLVQSRDGSSASVSSAGSSGQTDSSYQDRVTEQWNAVMAVSNELVRKEQTVIDQPTLDAFSASVGVTIKRIDNARQELEAIDAVPSEFRVKHAQLTSSLSSLEDYLTKLQSLSAKQAADVKQADFKPVDTAGSDAKKKTDTAADEMAFLKRLPQGLFTLQTDLLAFYQSVWEKGAPSAQRPVTGTPRPAGQQPSGSSSSLPAGAPGPDDAINYFGSYYVSGDPDGMSTIIIGQAVDDFNAQQSNNIPYSHEILEGPAVDGGNYIYRVMYLFRNGDAGPYLEDWTMVVTQQGSAFYITGANLNMRSEFTDN